MGNANSRQRITQPFRDAASYLAQRVQVWNSLQALIERIQGAIEIGQKRLTAAPTKVLPTPHDATQLLVPPDPMETANPGEQGSSPKGAYANVTERADTDVGNQEPTDPITVHQSSEDAGGSPEIEDTSSRLSAGSVVPKNEVGNANESDPAHVVAEDDMVARIRKALEEALPQQEVSIRRAYQTRVRGMDAIYNRLLPDLDRPPLPDETPDGSLWPEGHLTQEEQPQAKRSLKRGDSPSPKAKVSKYVDEYDNQVAEYVFSSLKVALPQFDIPRTDTEMLLESADFGPSETMMPGTVATSQSPRLPASVAKPANKLRPAPPERPLDQDERRTLQNYSTWDRELYSGLRLDSNSIRLVDIQPGTSDDKISVRMSVHSLYEVAFDYEALSYVWGEPEPKQNILIEAEPKQHILTGTTEIGILKAGTTEAGATEVPINPSLHTAIKSLRQSDSVRRIWIDAICLNQTSFAEKSKEVKKMGKIYTLAKTVNVFLGAPPTDEPTAIDSFFQFLNRNDAGESSAQYDETSLESFARICEKCQTNIDDVCTGFVELCLQPWWGRIWTLQEFYLAKEEPTWYWGRAHASNASLKRDFGLLAKVLLDRLAHGDANSILSRVDKNRPIGSFKDDVERAFALISRRYCTDGFDSPRRLYRELTAQATNPRDFVYGLRAIFEPVFGKVFVPDYQMRTEQLFTCLAVFLIHFECWGDHIQPHELDVQPLDQPAEEGEDVEPKLVVRNHRLHAFGYNLDKVYGHRHLDKYDGQKIFEELWQYDHSLNNNHECHQYFLEGVAPDDLWMKVFLDMYGSFYAGWTHFNSAFRGPVLQSTIRQENHDRLPRQVAECVPCWDLLRWHALRSTTPGLVEVLPRNDNNSGIGCLEEIFSSRMDAVFRQAFADFFIGASIFDWDHLAIWLYRFPDAKQWSQRNDIYWSRIRSSLQNDPDKRAKAIADAYTGYAADIWPEISRVSWCYSFYYTFLAYVVLLDCDDHSHLLSIIQKLQRAGNTLRGIYSSTTNAQIEILAAKVPSIATRTSHYDTVVDLFRGRYYVWTDGGFRGISCPGVEICCDKKSILAIVDGLSFPVIVRDYDEETVEGSLAGCAVMRGIDMLSKDTEKAILPPDYKRGEKRIFKFR